MDPAKTELRFTPDGNHMLLASTRDPAWSLRVRCRFAKSIAKTIDGGNLPRAYMQLAQVMPEGDVDRLYPSIASAHRAVQRRKAEATAARARNEKRNRKMAEKAIEARERREILGFTRGMSIRSAASMSL